MTFKAQRDRPKSPMFQGEVMRCIVCGQQERSHPRLSSDWRGFVLDGTKYYACPKEFPADTADGPAFQAAYDKVLTTILEKSGMMLQIAGFKVGYHTDLTKDYVLDRDSVKALDELHNLARKWKPFLGEAYALIMGMTDTQFEEWQEGARKEVQGEFAGRAYALAYGKINIPSPLLAILSIAKHYGLPEGAALLKLEAMNLARIHDERIELHNSLFGGVGDGWRR